MLGMPNQPPVKSINHGSILASIHTWLIKLNLFVYNVTPLRSGDISSPKMFPVSSKGTTVKLKMVIKKVNWNANNFVLLTGLFQNKTTHVLIYVGITSNFYWIAALPEIQVKWDPKQLFVIISPVTSNVATIIPEYNSSFGKLCYRLIQ